VEKLKQRRRQENEEYEIFEGIPPPPPQPPPEVPYVDRGPEVVASTLAPQLGTQPIFLQKGRWDMTILSHIESVDRPFFLYAFLKGRKWPIWRRLHDYLLRLNLSVDGRGRRDIIRMEGVAKGGLPEIIETQKPGFFQRIFSRKKTELEGL